MWDTIWIILIILLMAISFVGSVLPILPGPLLAFIAITIYKLSSVGESLSWWWVAISFILTCLAIVTEYLIPIITTKKFGGSKYGAIGATIGVVLGIFLPFFGFIWGPFIGALIGELINDYVNHKRALKASFGAFLGFFFGVGVNLIVCGIIATFMVVHSVIKYNY